MSENTDIPKAIKNRNKKAGLTAKGDQRQFVQHSYSDRSNEVIENLTASDENILRLYSEDSVGGPFPIKLQIVLKVTEKLGQQHIISWLPHGRSFMIHRPREFEEEIMGKFFKQTKLTSFRRQLNLYDFQRITHGRDAGSYYHELFLRGKPLLVKKMIRRKVKGTKIRASSSPDDEPNFYNMPFLGPIDHNGAKSNIAPSNLPIGSLMGQKNNGQTVGSPSGGGIPPGRNNNSDAMGAQANPVAASHLAALSQQLHQNQGTGFSHLEQSLRGPSVFDAFHQNANLQQMGYNSLHYQQALHALQGPMQPSIYGDLAQAQARQMFSQNAAIDNFLRYSNAINNSSLYHQMGDYSMLNRDAVLLDSMSGLRGLSNVAAATDASLSGLDPMLSPYQRVMQGQMGGLPGGMGYPNLQGQLSSLMAANSSMEGLQSDSAVNQLLEQKKAEKNTSNAQVASTLVGLKEQNV